MVTAFFLDGLKESLKDFRDVILKSENISTKEYELVLVVPDFNTNKVTLIVSARWLDNHSSYELMGKMIPVLRRHLSDNQEWLLVSRMLFLDTTDTFVQNLSSNNAVLKYIASGPIATIQNLRFEDEIVPTAYLIDVEKLDENSLAIQKEEN